MALQGIGVPATVIVPVNLSVVSGTRSLTKRHSFRMHMRVDVCKMVTKAIRIRKGPYIRRDCLPEPARIQRRAVHIGRLKYEIEGSTRYWRRLGSSRVINRDKNMRVVSGRALCWFAAIESPVPVIIILIVFITESELQVSRIHPCANHKLLMQQCLHSL